MSSLSAGLRRKSTPERKAPGGAPEAKPAGRQEPAGKAPADQAAGTAPQSPDAATGAGTPQEKRPGAPGYLQAKLAISHPQDPEEREADQVAGDVRRALRRPQDAAAGTPCPTCSGTAPRGSLEPAITPPKKEVLAPKLLRAVATGEGEKTTAATGEGEKAGTTPGAKQSADTPKTAAGGADALAGKTAPPATEQRIAARQGQGAPLDPELRAKLEAQLGRDLSAVRIHTDAEADAMCVEMHARAFTVGNDVYFTAGSYAPESDAGLELLAHELAHVGQQAEAGGPQSAAPKLQRDFWDDLFGGGGAPGDPMAACKEELDKSEKWARAGPYPAAPQGIVGAGGIGGFDAQYKPDPAEGDGMLDIKQGVAVEFKDTLVVSGGAIVPHPDLPVTPAITALAARINAIPIPLLRSAVLAAYQWTPAERAPWISQLKSLIETTWGGQHSFFLNRPRWNWLGADVRVALDIGARAKAAGDHMATETYKMPTGESLRTYDISHEVGSGSGADAYDQTMRLASTTTGPKEYDLLRESVEFGNNSDVLTPAAIGTLNAFINQFNGATANAAHQEVRVEIVGHASASGSEKHNMDLSQRRAEAVRDYLANNGFANTASRVTLTPRGETEADQTQPKLASDRRVDLIVDGGERMITAAHEWGHAFGLDDEYLTGGTNIGDPVAHDAMAKAMTDAGGNPLPGAIKEHNAGIMSFGTEVRPRHYATFHHALTTVTAQSPWSLGLHKPKWQVAM
ncbi:eCIS core domain-containing protein, partial [Devosia sp.]|uniref:eCIS core domain-containing protein n=1 Tax=Devosia sp. TaxID=1871048 RepID=UPI002F0F68CC